MATAHYVIGLDVGTTTVRSYVYDKDGQVVGSGDTVVDIVSPQQGWVEIDPDLLWDKVVMVIQQSITTAGITAGQVSSLGISCQRATFTCWHKKTGEYFHNFITWKDMRADNYVREWNNSFTLKGLRMGGKLLHWLTRMPRYKAAGILKLNNGMVVMRLLWALENIPELKKAVSEGDAMFGCVDTWLLYKLTGNHKTEVSNIAATGLFDPFTMQYAGWAFSLFSLPLSIMPEVVDSCGEHFGAVRSDILGHSVPVRAVLADQSASAFGSSCYSPGSAKITLGTGSFLDVITSKPHASMEGLVPLVGWRIEDDTTYLAEGCVHDTGVMVSWAKTVGLFDNIDDISDIVSALPSSNGLYFIPGFHGLQVPIQDSSATAGFLGLRLNTTKEEMLRAVLESIAYSLTKLVSVFISETRDTLAQVVVDGGVSRNNFIVQMIADLTGITIIRPDNVEVSAWGVAALAGLGAGVWQNRDQLDKIKGKNGEVFIRRKEWTDSKGYSKWEEACERFTLWNINNNDN